METPHKTNILLVENLGVIVTAKFDATKEVLVVEEVEFVVAFTTCNTTPLLACVVLLGNVNPLVPSIINVILFLQVVMEYCLQIAILDRLANLCFLGRWE